MRSAEVVSERMVGHTEESTRSGPACNDFTTRVYAGPTTATHVFRYAVAPDGKRFLINSTIQTEQQAQAPITVVLNWLQGVRK